MSEKTIRVGLIGCGSVGLRMHIPTWMSQPGVEIVALADPLEPNLHGAAELSGVEPTSLYRDPMGLIHRDDIDVVDICTPQHLRRDLLLESAKAGKHILCEKPLTVRPQDAADAVDAAERNSVVFGVVHPYLWLPEIRLARELIAEGRIGETRSVIVNYLGVIPEAGAAGSWRRDPATAGGGVLTDMLHAVYEAEALLAEPFERVSAHVTSSDKALRVEDQALCRFESNSRAALVNVAWGLGAGGVEVAGSGGRISVRYEAAATPPWAPIESFVVADQNSVHDLTETCRVEGDRDSFPTLKQAFDFNFRDFVGAVRAGTTPTAGGGDGLRILEAVLGAYKSAATGQMVSLSLDRGEPIFLDGAPGVAHYPRPAWSEADDAPLFSSATVA